jgi:hypothetical protein
VSVLRNVALKTKLPLAVTRTFIKSNSIGGMNMNTGLKNKLLILAAAAGLTGFAACGSSEEPPAAEEGAPAETTGGEAAPAEEQPAPAEASPEGAPAEGASKGGEGSCGEGSCS